ncbi:GNAT family N-acetyltransferase [Streptomyces californicus]
MSPEEGAALPPFLRGDVRKAGSSGGPLQVAPLGELRPEQEAYWQALYDLCGSRVQQSPAYARAVGESGRDVLVVMGHRGVFPLQLGSDVCTALGGDRPLLADCTGPLPLVALVAAAADATGLPVYLPLVDASLAEAGVVDAFSVWERPPNSLIDWSLDGADLWDRVTERGGSQWSRKRRLVERDGLNLSFGRSGEAAAEEVLRIDDRSWKSARGQNMRAREGQDRLYAGLIGAGVLTATFLRDGDHSVAFRLDSRVKGRLTCLKWSYDESYRRYSPGVHLLTQGLRQEWCGRGIEVVDLHGSPDSLKDLLCTDRMSRVDLWYGDPLAGARRAAERTGFDRRMRAVRDSGKGLRHAFE